MTSPVAPQRHRAGATALLCVAVPLVRLTARLRRRVTDGPRDRRRCAGLGPRDDHDGGPGRRACGRSPGPSWASSSATPSTASWAHDRRRRGSPRRPWLGRLSTSPSSAGLLTLLFAAVLQLGIALYVHNMLVSCAAEGARAAARADRDPAEAVDQTRALVAETLTPAYAEDVSADQVTVGGVRTIAVRVRAPLPVFGLFGPAHVLRAPGHAFVGAAMNRLRARSGTALRDAQRRGDWRRGQRHHRVRLPGRADAGAHRLPDHRPRAGPGRRPRRRARCARGRASLRHARGPAHGHGARPGGGRDRVRRPGLRPARPGELTLTCAANPCLAADARVTVRSSAHRRPARCPSVPVAGDPAPGHPRPRRTSPPSTSSRCVEGRSLSTAVGHPSSSGWRRAPTTTARSHHGPGLCRGRPHARHRGRGHHGGAPGPHPAAGRVRCRRPRRGRRGRLRRRSITPASTPACRSPTAPSRSAAAAYLSTYPPPARVEGVQLADRPARRTGEPRSSS